MAVPSPRPRACFLGGASNPFVPPYDFRPLRLKKKIEAGADFIQTQYCFDIPRLSTFMERVVDMGLHERVYILVASDRSGQPGSRIGCETISPV